MRPLFRKIIILGSIFLVTLGVFLFLSRGGDSNDEPGATPAGNQLPLVSFGVEKVKVNTLAGYLEPMNEGTLLSRITPLSSDRLLPLYINTKGNTLTAISYEVRRIGDRGLIEQGTLSGWDTDGDFVTAKIPIKDLIDKGTEYELIVRLATEHQPSVGYYSRILWDDDLKTEKMMEYITDFHSATFSSSGAEKYAINWEVDATADNETLSRVNIHSNFKQLTYRDLKPEEVGEPEYSVLEMDRQFGSFLVRSTIKAASEDGTEQTYTVREFFCLQWSDQRNAQNTTPFYLMAYEREMEQVFNAGENDVGSRGISFGIVKADDVSVTASEDRKTYAISVGQRLWLFDREKAVFTTLYNPVMDEGSQKTSDYRIKVLELTDKGDATFIVYGYFNHGPHEGMTGASVWRYDGASQSLSELKFIRSDNGAETVEQEIETLAVKRGARVYFLLDDTVFVLTENGSELLRMVEGANKHGLCVNTNQTAIAWAQGSEARMAKSLSVLYLESGRTQSFDANEGEFLQAHGFIDNDFITTSGRDEDVYPSQLTRSYPCYALTIYTENGTEAAKYKYDGIYITEVAVGEGQVVLQRAKSDGKVFSPIEDDVLLQNAEQKSADGIRLSFEKQELRQKVGLLLIDGIDKDVKAKRVWPEETVYYAGADRAASESHTPEGYYAHSHGRLQGVYSEAGEAIAAVYADMGSVSDGTGLRIWRRSAKDPAKMTIAAAASEEAKDYDAMTQLLDAVFKLEDAEADAKALMEGGLSLGEAIEKGIPGAKAMDLEGCTIKQLYPFLAKKTPVFAILEDGVPVLLTGYDASNILMLKPGIQSAVRIGAELAQKEFEKAGSRFLTYNRQ